MEDSNIVGRLDQSVTQWNLFPPTFEKFLKKWKMQVNICSAMQKMSKFITLGVPEKFQVYILFKCEFTQKKTEFEVVQTPGFEF